MRNQIVILAAGKGTRMGSGDIPKVLVMLKNKPLIFYILHEIEKISQLIDPVVVVGYKADKVRGVLGDRYLYAHQDKQLGTAHAVLAARYKVKAENVLVLYGDMPLISAESLKRLIGLHLQSNAKVSMFTAKVGSFDGRFASLEHYGRILRDDVGNIIGIVEYKDATEEQKKIKEVNPGIYMFNTKWLWSNLEKIENHNSQGEYYLTDLVEIAIKQNIAINSLEINPGEATGINTLEELKQAEKI